MSLAIKTRMLAGANDDVSQMPEHQLAWKGDPAEGSVDRFPAGRLLNLEHVFLRWVNESWLEYLPHPEPDKRFSFVRSTGEVTTPGHIYTSGSILPRRLWTKLGLSSQDFLPPLLVHEWEYELRYAGRQKKSFEAVRATAMEGVHTLMTLGRNAAKPFVFRSIYGALSSPIARRLWDANPGDTLPESDFA
ncbi:MAG: hypothetical protein R3D57_17605 [Hyphomicrobiaceae bacterium]